MCSTDENMAITAENRVKSIHCNGRIIGPVRINARCQSKNNHVNLTLNNFVKATIFADMIVHIGTLDFINSNALKKSVLKYCTNTPSAIALLCSFHDYNILLLSRLVLNNFQPS
jgi:hypothetical protein